MKAYEETQHQYITYFDKNYALKGITLIQSLLQHDAKFHIFVVCLDQEIFQILQVLNFAQVTLIPLEIIESAQPQLQKAKKDRTLVEFYWTLTPCVIKHVLPSLPQGSILTYVDSDLFFWSSPQALYNDMGSAHIYIHEHNFPEALQSLAAHGRFNVGLMCFRHTEEGLRVLTWWQEKCLEWCKDYIDTDAEGKLRYGDQKYLDYFPSLTNKLGICSLIGAGIAPWNDSKFTLSYDENNVPQVDGKPVIFYHHHGFELFTQDCVSPQHNTYPLTLESIEFFHIPYVVALEKSLALIGKIQPNFTHGYNLHKLSERIFIIAREKLASQFSQANLSPQRVYLHDQEKFLFYNCSLEAQEERPQASPALEQALKNYHRFPQKPRLLNLGCGSHFHRAWLNVDIASASPSVYACDLRREWPLPQDFFDMVYHSHVLEHMSEKEGKKFIKQCHAVLKPHGVLRIAIPDLENIVRHYLKALEEAKAQAPGAQHRHRWMVIELIDQVSRHHSGGSMAEYCKQSPTPEKEFVLQRIGREGESLIAALEGLPLHEHEESNATAVGKFRLGGEVHRWMYDAFSLQELLLEMGFTDIRLVQAQESSYENFASFMLDADGEGRIRKPDSLFMEARKPEQRVLRETCSVEPKIEYRVDCKGNWGDSYYSTWQEAQQAATGYANQSIFKRVYEAAKSVQQGKALWERDSVLMHHEEYNIPLLTSLLDFAKQQHSVLHVLDFGGGLGSTYEQHKKQLQHLSACSWNIVEQMHVQKCGCREFATPVMRFYSTIQEAFQQPINIALFSGVLQYIDPQWALEILQEMQKNSIRRIIIDRTPFRCSDALFTVQKPESIYPGASYPIHLMDFTVFNRFLQSLGYTLTGSAKALDGTWSDCDFLLLQYDLLTSM